MSNIITETLGGLLRQVNYQVSGKYEIANPEIGIAIRVPGQPSLDVMRGKYNCRAAIRAQGDALLYWLGLAQIAKGVCSHHVYRGLRSAAHMTINLSQRVEADMVSGVLEISRPIMDPLYLQQHRQALNGLPSLPGLTPLAQSLGRSVARSSQLEPRFTDQQMPIVAIDISGKPISDSLATKALSRIGNAFLSEDF